MGMTVRKRKDVSLPIVLMHRVADIRGGITVDISEVNVDFLREGTPVSAPINGVCHIVKFAKVYENAGDTATSIKVYKGHNFKVTDVVCAGESGAAYAITAIDASNTAYDTITIGTTLGVALVKDTSFLFQASVSGATGSALKYEPFAILGTGKPVIAGDNFDCDAWVIGVTKGNELPALIAGKLKGIINYD